MSTDFNFNRMRNLLRKHIGEPEIQELVRNSDNGATHSAHVGFLQFQEHGVAIMFKEAPWIVRSYPPGGEKDLYVNAIHFYSNGYEANSQYQGELPGGVHFGDSEDEVVRKLGMPHDKGGGGYIKLLKKTAPAWVKYDIEEDILNIQFNEERRVDLVTLFTKPLK